MIHNRISTASERLIRRPCRKSILADPKKESGLRTNSVIMEEKVFLQHQKKKGLSLTSVEGGDWEVTRLFYSKKRALGQRARIPLTAMHSGRRHFLNFNKELIKCQLSLHFST
jgi:hypothetical protein